MAPHETALRQVRVWDLPVRLFHWALPVLMLLLFLSAYAGRMKAHALLGEIVLALVLFRIAWGLIGSQTARFSDFIGGAGGIRAYVANGRARSLGHNPLGSLMVLALVGTLLAQSLLGLFSSDGFAFDGPWARWIGVAASDAASRAHVITAYVIVGLAAVHVVAIFLHWLLRGENLISPMLSGFKRMPAHTADPVFAPPALALAAFICAAIAVVAAIRMA